MNNKKHVVLIHQYLNKQIEVFFDRKDKNSIIGTLRAYDQHMSLVLDDVTFSDKTKEKKILLRGNNIFYIKESVIKVTEENLKLIKTLKPSGIKKEKNLES